MIPLSTPPRLNRRQWLHHAAASGTVLAAAPSILATTKHHASLRAGAATVDITPTRFPIRVSGSIAERWTDEVSDHLHVRALVLDDGARRLGLAVVDNLFLGEALIRAAKERVSRSVGIPEDHLMVSATHTHSAPPVVSCHGNNADADYAHQLETGIVDALTAAARRLVPAEIGWAQAECRQFIHCRRWLMRPGKAFTVPHTGHPANLAQMNPGHQNPEALCPTGPVDPLIPVLAVRRASDRRPLAVLAARHGHYAGAPGISADKYGAFARTIGERLDADGAFVGILACGTLGDANCIDFSQPRQTFDYRQVGQALAEAVHAAWNEVRWQPTASLDVETSRLRLARRRPSREEVRAAQAFLDQNLGDQPVKTWEQNYARETVLLGEAPPTLHLPHQALRIGDGAMVTSPCEVFGSTGLKLRARSPFEVQMNLGLANGYAGYLPPPDEHALGGYTTWRARSSCLAEPAEVEATQAMLQLLGILHSRNG